MSTKRRLAAAVLLAAALGVAPTGCYKHVIREEGIGADRDVDVYEPNRTRDVFDDINDAFEPKPKPKPKE